MLPGTQCTLKNPAMLMLLSLLLTLCSCSVRADNPFQSQQPDFSGDVTACKGYSVDSVRDSSTGGLLADLSLINNCSAFGKDIGSLTVSVEYETASRLHIHIYDTALQQYQIDDWVSPRPQGDNTTKASSDLAFDYNPSPFEFWVTRKSDGAELFDTRTENIPVYNDTVNIQDLDQLNTHGANSNYTIMPAHPLVFEDQYLQISSAMPVDTHLYGLGEVISASGFRRNTSGTVQTMWSRGSASPVEENTYGIHPMYMELRWNDTAKATRAHGTFLLNSHGMDVILRDGVIEYRAIGGTLDFYFFSGPTPNEVAQQYAQTVGLPQAMSFWSFGFHLCRWGYPTLNDTKNNVKAMRDAGIPLEVQWNDLDWMRRNRNFVFDLNYDPIDYKAFVDELHANNQHYIPLIDGPIAILTNDTDVYDVYSRGHELGAWITNSDGTEYVGSMWPGYTVFPDWFNPSMKQVWFEAFQNLSQVVDFDGIWLDINEPTSFTTGTQRNSTLSINETLLNPSSYPNGVATIPPNWPEGYNGTFSGVSGNITVNGSLTYGASGPPPVIAYLKRNTVSPTVDRHTIPSTNVFDPRQLGHIDYPQVPSYEIRDRDGYFDVVNIYRNTIDTIALHSNGIQEYSVHNLWGYMEEIITNDVLYQLKPNTRPFIVGRAQFAGAGRKSAHWLGDNYSTWSNMQRSIQGVLQFNLFAMPMVGPDTCGFVDNSDEELCNRWMQLSAFYPFYRNHNSVGAIGQEPYRWDSVRNASITAIQARYAMLPIWESLFADAACAGTPPVRALFHEFDDPKYYNIHNQFLVGDSILVTPQLHPNSSTVSGVFPSADGVTWTNWFTHEVVDTSSGENVTVEAPLSTIPVHVRSGRVLLLHSNPAYTLTETRSGGYGLLVTLDGKGYAEGWAKLDDGLSWPVHEQTDLAFTAESDCTLSASCTGAYSLPAPLTEITILCAKNSSTVLLNGAEIASNQVQYEADVKELRVTRLSVDLCGGFEVRW